MEIGTRISQILKEKKLTQTWLAKRVGVSQQAISEIINGRTRLTGYIVKIADALDISPHMLTYGKEPLLYNDNLDKLVTRCNPITKIPLLSWHQLKPFYKTKVPHNTEDKFIDTSDCKSLYLYGEMPKNSFALPVLGDAMISSHPYSKSFLEKDILVVDPNLITEHGDFVIAFVDKDLPATFRQYIIESGIEYLSPLNPKYPLIEVNDKTHILGVVIFSQTAHKK